MTARPKQPGRPKRQTPRKPARRQPRSRHHSPGAAREAPTVLAAELIRHLEATGNRADLEQKAFARERRLDPETAGRIARAVHAWYCWKGWVGVGAAGARAVSPARIAEALEMAERFASAPASIPADQLLERALPAWVRDAMPVSTEFISSIQKPPPLWLRARPGTAPRVAEAIGGEAGAGGSRLPDAVRYAGTTDLFRTSAFREGRFEIQDIASQAVGLVCQARPGEMWWDACAGEGGKTLHLADMMENRGVVWASDRSRRRLAVLRRRAARAGLFNIRIKPWGQSDRRPVGGLFDGVLVDAPCSGVGTWGRHPQARWTTTPEDVRELAEVQKRLLASAAEAVKPRGHLVYAVCTLTEAETSGVADAFGKEHPEFEPAEFADPFGCESDGPAPGRAAWWPHLSGGNGMFVAVWRRNSH